MKNNKEIKEALSRILSHNLRCFGIDKKGEPCQKRNLTPSHLFKESDAIDINSRVSEEDFYDYSDVNNVVPFCMDCHMLYERLPVVRIEYAISKGVKLTRLEYLEKCRMAHSGVAKKYLSNYINRFKFYENVLCFGKQDLENCKVY